MSNVRVEGKVVYGRFASPAGYQYTQIFDLETGKFYIEIDRWAGFKEYHGDLITEEQPDGVRSAVELFKDGSCWVTVKNRNKGYCYAVARETLDAVREVERKSA